MDNDSRQRVWRYLLSRSDELAVDLPPVERIAAPIEESHWYVAIAALQNEVLARAHERAAGPTSFALVKSIADNNLMARQRIRNEHAMCQTVVASIRAANASAEFASLSASSRSLSSEGTASARSAPSSNSGLGSATAGGGSLARYGNSFRGAGAAGPGSLLAAAASWPRLKPVPATAAKVILAPIFPTSAPEPDAVSNNADVQFVAALRLIALHRPLDVPRVVKRFLFSTLRVPQARAWRGPSLSVCLPRTFIRAMMVNPAELAAAAAAAGGSSGGAEGPSLRWGSDTQTSGDNTPTSYRSHALGGESVVSGSGDGGGSGFPRFSDAGEDDDDGSSYREEGGSGSGQGEEDVDGGEGSRGGSPVSLSALVSGGDGGGVEGEGEGAPPPPPSSSAPLPRDASLSIMSDSLWSADEEGGGEGDVTPAPAADASSCEPAVTAPPALQLPEGWGAASSSGGGLDSATSGTPRPKSLTTAKSARELRAGWMAAAASTSGPSTPVASATAPATDRSSASGGGSGRRGSTTGEAGGALALPPPAPVSASALSPSAGAMGGSSSVWSPSTSGTPPPGAGWVNRPSGVIAGASPEPGPGFYADAPQATPPSLKSISGSSPSATSPAAAAPEATGASSPPPTSSAWEPQVLDLVRAMTEVAGNHSSGAKLSVLAGIFKTLYTPPPPPSPQQGSAAPGVAATSPPGPAPSSDATAAAEGSSGREEPRESTLQPFTAAGATAAASSTTSGGEASSSLPAAPTRTVRYGRSTGTATPLLSSRTASDEATSSSTNVSPSRLLPASSGSSSANGGPPEASGVTITPRLSPGAGPAAPAATPASGFLIGLPASRSNNALPALTLEPSALPTSPSSGVDGAATLRLVPVSSPPTTPVAAAGDAAGTSDAASSPVVVHGVTILSDETKAAEARAVLQAALEDVRTFCVGFARGVLHRYPVLGALPARLPRSQGGSGEDGIGGEQGQGLGLLQQGITRVSVGSSGSGSGSSSSSGGGGGILAGVKRVTGVGRSAAADDGSGAIIGASRDAVLSWGRVNPGAGGGAGAGTAGSGAAASARAAARRGSASSTGSSSGPGAAPGSSSSSTSGLPSATDTIDCTKLVLRIVQEAFYSFIFPTLYPLIRQAYVTADAEWEQALGVLQSASPCVFGLRALYCDYGTTCCATHAALPGDTEAIDPAVGLFKCVGPSPPARAAVVHGQAITTLRLLPRQRTPLGKANALRACMQAVTAGSAMECELEDIEKRHRAALALGSLASPPSSSSSAVAGPVGADDMMPRLCFIVAQAGIPAMFSELAYLEHCLPHDRSLGEDGYAVVSLRGALMHCLDLASELRAAGAAAAGGH